jgi:hypothetical protein
MSVMTYGRVIGREHNVVRVDFRREPDPPAPTFPGANGLRRMTDAERERGGEASLVSRRFVRSS